MSVEIRGKSMTIRYRDARGKLVRETLGPVGVVSMKDARTIERDRVNKVKLEQWAKPVTITFAALSKLWFSETERTKNWAPRTVRANRRSLRRLDWFAKKKVVEVSRRDVERWVADQLEAGYSAKTIGFDLSTLKGVLQYGVVHEYLHKNVAENAPRPRVRRKQWRILTPDEVRQVEKGFTSPRHRLAFKTLVRTGLRRGELQNLRVEDVDFQRAALRVVESKTEEGERWVSLSAAFNRELYSWCVDRKPTDYVFAGPDGGRLNSDLYAADFKKALTKAGITDYVRPFHDLRHTSLTNEAATAESNPLALMARAGHRSMATTRQYTHLAGVLFPQQAEALDRLYSGPEEAA